MKIRSLSLVLCLLLSISIQAQSSSNDPQIGLLWEISGNNLKSPSYLYGTMHVSQKVAFHLSDTFFIALKNVDQIALESDPSTWMDQFGKEFNAGRYNAYAYRNNNDNFYQTAFGLNRPTKTKYRSYLSTESNQVNHMLYRRTQSRVNFQERTYLDLFIFQAAKRSGKGVVALENHEETMALLEKASQPETDPLKKKRNIPYGLTQNIHQKIEEAYRQGNLSLLDSLHKMSLPTDRYYRYFIEERNIIMANGMDSLMEANVSLFTGVGAAHLPGRLGVINLLKDKGYTVRPIITTVSNKHQKLKKKIENTVVPLDLQTRYPADSAFKVDFPGKLYQTSLYSDSKEYLYPEMMNGAFFSIARIHSYNPLLGIDEALTLKVVDSLLFENIPGDIEKKTIGTKNGFQCIDILNKTRTGDYQRYQIVFTPLEVFIFKVGGTGKYVLGADVNKFFNSIEIFGQNLTEALWVAPKHDLVTAKMYPMQVRQDFESSALQAKTAQIQAYHLKKKSFQLLISSKLVDYEYIEEDRFDLEELTKAFAKQFDYELSESSFGLHKGFPCMEALLKKEGSEEELRTKVIIKGMFYYLAACNNKEDSKQFFESISFKTATYKDSMTTYVDTTMLFTVETIPDIEPTMVRSAYEYGYYLDDFYGTWDSGIQNKLFKCKATNEEIKVTFETFGRYECWEDSTFWEDFEEDYLEEDDNLTVQEIKRYEVGVSRIRLVHIKDSLSFRQIRAKEILHKGALYRILYCSDSLDQPSAFVSTFFETFEPSKDTFIDNKIFEPQYEQFFTDLYSEDSATLADAKRLYKQVDIYETPTARDKLAQFLHAYECDGTDLNIKAHFIARLSRMKDSSITDDLIKLYTHAQGKTTIELACLNGLARRDRKKDYDALLALAKNGDLPLPFYEKDLKSLFMSLDDSLELAMPLFPDLYQYLSYPEYKDKIFGLLAELVNQKGVDAAIYGLQKKRIIREAMNGLKRQLAGEEKHKEIYFGPTPRNYYRSNLEEPKIEQLFATKLNSKAYIDEYKTNATTYSHQLIFLTKLMLPLYEEEAAKPFFDKLLTIKSASLLLKLSDLLLNAKKPVPDSLWTKFVAHPSTKIPAYLILKEAKRLDLMDSVQMTQEQFVAGLLDLDYQKDSVVFLKKEWLQHSNAYGESMEGYLYFFKSKSEENDYWTLEFGGLQPKDSTIIKSEGRIIQKRKMLIVEGVDVDEMIEKQLEQLKNRHRKRLGLVKLY